MKNLTAGKPIKLILLFAIPLFIGQLFQLFYSLVDTYIVGSTLGDAELAAVSSITTLSDMLNSLLNGFTNGYAIVIHCRHRTLRLFLCSDPQCGMLDFPKSDFIHNECSRRCFTTNQILHQYYPGRTFGCHSI